MFIIKRIQILYTFIVGTMVALVHVPFPEFSTEVIYNLIKKLEDCVLKEYGFEDDESVCGDIRCSEQGSCDVAEEDGGDDGVTGPCETNGFIKVGESESDECEHEKSA